MTPISLQNIPSSLEPEPPHFLLIGHSPKTPRHSKMILNTRPPLIFRDRKQLEVPISMILLYSESEFYL